MNIQDLTENLHQLNFTAIDFETANEQRTSICSMGMVVVRSGKVVSEEHFYVKPKDMRFTEINTRIHGISYEDVQDACEFPVLWEQLAGRFHHEIVLAHNASFDIDVLKQTLDAYHLAHPVLRYACTQKLAQEVFTGLPGYRLSDVAAHIGFDLQHHHALSDARAAAAIGTRTIPQLAGHFHHEHEELTYHIAKRTAAAKKSSFGYNGKHMESSLLKPDLQQADASHLFYNRKVVFTGDLQSMSRKEAALKVQRLGADIDTAISRKTQVVIMGQKAGPAKLKKIEALKAEGCAIWVVEEEEFLRLLKS